VSALEAVRVRLGAVVAAVETLGPIVELDRLWRQPGRDVAHAKKVRAWIQDVLDRPRCPYDDSALELYRALVDVPIAERARARSLVGPAERRALAPAPVRSPWLALEEQSFERLAAGVALLAFLLPDEDDYRDVMISLAPARVAADELGADAAAVFDEAASFAGRGVAETIRRFGLRKTGLGAFGWQRAQTPHGERFHLLL
jgi:hypothetical protein